MCELSADTLQPPQFCQPTGILQVFRFPCRWVSSWGCAAGEGRPATVEAVASWQGHQARLEQSAWLVSLCCMLQLESLCLLLMMLQAPILLELLENLKHCPVKSKSWLPRALPPSPSTCLDLGNPVRFTATDKAIFSQELRVQQLT